jgi:hypothetical protein
MKIHHYFFASSEHSHTKKQKQKTRYHKLNLLTRACEQVSAVQVSQGIKQIKRIFGTNQEALLPQRAQES